MNYESITKRLNRAIDKAMNKAVSCKIHIVDFGTETKDLAGLVIVRAKPPKKTEQNTPPDKTSAH